jgi:mono/diheme cytochrome c family protein
VCTVPRDHFRVLNFLARLSFTVVLFAAGSSQPANGQVKQATKAKEDAGLRDPRLIERGRYIVEGVAMCERCHTRRDERGNPDRTNWLMGGPVQTNPTYSAPDWATSEPRLAGLPPGTDAEFVTLLTTGISRTGRPPNPPMPPFRMTREDAQAVLAYLKSLRP